MFANKARTRPRPAKQSPFQVIHSKVGSWPYSLALYTRLEDVSGTNFLANYKQSKITDVKEWKRINRKQTARW